MTIVRATEADGLVTLSLIAPDPENTLPSFDIAVAAFRCQHERGVVSLTNARLEHDGLLGSSDGLASGSWDIESLRGRVRLSPPPCVPARV